MKKIKTNLPDYIALAIGFEDLNASKQYRITPEQHEIVKELRLKEKPNKRKLIETIVKKNGNGKILSTTEKLQSKPIEVPEGFEIVKISTSKTTGQQWIQYKPLEIDKEILTFDFEAIIKKHTENLKPIKIKPQSTNILWNDFDTLTYTDVHIGMDTNSKGNSMYADKWDRDSILKSAKTIVEETLKNQSSNVLIVDELGDFLDGYNAQTTRKGHELPQNMTNEEAFDCGLEFKMLLLNGLALNYDSIIFNNICNDNHAGSFGYFVNSAFKQLAEKSYSNVKVNNYRKFISHYIQDKVCFLITHGKDDSTLKFGFKPHLDTKQIEKIDQYIKRHNLYGKAERFIFKKGDSHQCLFDLSGSDDFDYFNYPALSPSSQWVQTNFKKGRKGFVIENFNGVESNQIVKFIK